MCFIHILFTNKRDYNSGLGTFDAKLLPFNALDAGYLTIIKYFVNTLKGCFPNDAYALLVLYIVNSNRDLYITKGYRYNNSNINSTFTGISIQHFLLAKTILR